MRTCLGERGWPLCKIFVEKRVLPPGGGAQSEVLNVVYRRGAVADEETSEQSS
jgi:hypothetical protein